VARKNFKTHQLTNGLNDIFWSVDFFFFFFTNIDCIFFSVIESHPDSVHEDLRLTRPFSRLVEYCNSLDMETMTQKASVIN
jgi:hypothetical protein